ncbi:MAG: apolipoprotein N-acyltransferase [Armatimonadota bacterium]
MKKRNLLLSVVSGIVLASAMPKPGLWFASWFGLAPLLLALRKSTPRQGALYGLVTGFVYFGAICVWLSIFGYLPWFLVALKEAVWVAFFAGIAVRFLQNSGVHAYLGLPAVWTVIQWARVFGPLGFTWGSFAHTQADSLVITQLGSITGPWGIDFLVCLANVAVAEVACSILNRANIAKALGYVFLTAVLVSAVVYYGHCSMLKPAAPSGQKHSAVIIQGSLTHDVNPTPEYVVEAYMLYHAMTSFAGLSKPDLIVWPETTIVDCITRQRWGPLISRLARNIRANMIVGGYDYSGDVKGRNYNAAHFFDRAGRKIGVYRKVHLVPYGEYVPLRKQLPWLKRYGIREVDVLPGKRHTLVNTDIGTMGTAICFESIFPAVTAKEVRNGASLLVVITNDAWFKRSQAARQHLMMARLRAVETRRYVVRAASTGISAIIDPQGHIVSQLGIFRRGIVRGSVIPSKVLTPYVRFGDWFAYVCIVLATSLAIFRARRKKRLIPKVR